MRAMPAEDTPEVASTSGKAKDDAHQAEIQAVKLRAVKKIKALEERCKAATDDLAAESAFALAARRALAAEIEALEEDGGSVAMLQAALALQQQQELSLSGSLQALQLSKADLEDVHARETAGS